MLDYIDLYRPLVEICGSCSLPPAKAKAAFVACHQHKRIIFGDPNAGGPLYACPPKPSGILNQAIHTGANRESNRQSNRQFNRQFYNNAGGPQHGTEDAFFADVGSYLRILFMKFRECALVPEQFSTLRKKASIHMQIYVNTNTCLQSVHQ
jgi:hypothetical protein